MEVFDRRREEKGLQAAVLVWLINSAALLIASMMLSGMECDSVKAAFLTGLLLTAIAYLIEPVIYLLTLPLNIATFGLFNVALNGLVLIAASRLVKGIHFHGGLWKQFLWAVCASLIVGFFRMLLRRQLVRMSWIRRGMS